jgi:hypothetical protein
MSARRLHSACLYTEIDSTIPALSRALIDCDKVAPYIIIYSRCARPCPAPEHIFLALGIEKLLEAGRYKHAHTLEAG